MIHSTTLEPTRCALCGCFGEATVLWEARLDSRAFTPEVFSARRVPDRIHYRMVRCDECGLVRSDPVLRTGDMRRLYESASFDYEDELAALTRTYSRALSAVETLTVDRALLVDIGCGNGFVLEEALRRGWLGVAGVEPTRNAVKRAAPKVASCIHNDVMRPGLFAQDSVSAMTLFQVLDHLPDPLSLLVECRRALKPGGVILAWNHNVGSWSARLLGESSPIVDVEHTYLYDPVTMKKLFERAGFEEIQVRPVKNYYSLKYLLHLLPIKAQWKNQTAAFADRLRIGDRELLMPLGNLCLTARS